MKAISPIRKKKKPPVSPETLRDAMRGLDRFVDSVCRIVPVIRGRRVAKSA